MNSLIQILRETWARFKALVAEGLRRVEESALFERLVSEYEGLELRQQKWIRATIVLVIAVTMLLLLTIPLTSIVTQKSNLRRSRLLVNEMRSFQDQMSVTHIPAPRPTGFQSLPAGNASEFEDSFKGFLGSIGLTGDLADFTSNGTGQWKLSVPELSIRQALAIVFQLDGWFPSIAHDKLKIKVNSDNKQLVTLESEVRFVDAPAAGATGASDLDVAPTTSRRSGGGTASNSTGGSTAPSSGATRSTRPGTPRSNPGTGGDDFDNDLPPPTFEDDQ